MLNLRILDSAWLGRVGAVVVKSCVRWFFRFSPVPVGSMAASPFSRSATSLLAKSQRDLVAMLELTGRERQPAADACICMIDMIIRHSRFRWAMR